MPADAQRSPLEAKTRDELNVLAARLSIQGYRRLSKAQLVDALVALGPAALDGQPTWWERYHTHVYGLASVISVVLAVTFFMWPRDAVADAVERVNVPTDRVSLTTERRVTAEVDDILARDQVVICEPDVPVVSVASRPRPTNDGFVVLQQDNVWDARGWKPVSADLDCESGSPLTRHWSVQVRRVGTEDRFVLAPKTAGTDLVSRIDSTLPYTLYAIAEPRVVGDQRLIERQIEFDVSSVPVGGEFTLRGTHTYWNSMQTPNDLWVGAIARAGLRGASTLVVLPADRPFKDHDVTKARNDSEIQEVPDDYEGDNHFVLPDRADGRWIYWEVVEPQPGHVYQLRWEW